MRSSTQRLPGATWLNEARGLRAASPNGDLVVTEQTNGSMWKRGPLIVSNAATSKTIRTLETHNSPSTGLTNTLMFSRDGRHFVWADTDLMGNGMAKVWEVSTWRVIVALPVSAVNFSRDSRSLVLGYQTGVRPTCGTWPAARRPIWREGQDLQE